MAADWQRVREVFLAAVEKRGEERARYLEGECGPDKELRAEVERLLDRNSEGGDLLDTAPRRNTHAERELNGRTLAHYHIVQKIGSGGMGEVWKAEDSQLRRAVALKFLSLDATGNQEIRTRLIREAQAAASLDHPNICAVHGIHEEGGETFIAMAFINGPSLAAKIKERPLPIEEALDFAIQIAEGLQEAHENDIVHRDIKPHNVMLTVKGHVKIMDFGLASLAGRSKITKSGATLGTPAYMAPEQLEGQEVDRRADIWALGCVLYEMLAQRSPFDAEYEQAIAYGILNTDPEPISAQRADVTPEVDRLLSKALAKDPAERYQHADDLLADLRVLRKQTGDRKGASGRSTILGASQATGAFPAASTAGQTVRHASTPPADVISVRRGRQFLERAVAVIATLAFLVLSAFHFGESPPEPPAPTRRFSVSLEGLRSASISPDGRYIAFATGTMPQSSLWLRAIGTETTREIPGTEGARPRLGWSPDSRTIVFATRTQVKRVDIDGGDAITLGDLRGSGFDGFRGVSWSPDGERIAFGSSRWVFEIPARGGERRLLIDRDLGDVEQPHFLPHGSGPEALVYQMNVGASTQIWVLNLKTGERSEVGPGSVPIYSRDGYLIHGPGERNESGLRALPFSLASLEPTGVDFPIAEDGQFASVAGDGTLVFLDGIGGGSQQTLVWRNRDGELLEEVGRPQPGMLTPSVSPDGRRIAVASMEGGDFDIWIHDQTGSTKTRLSFDEARELSPSWSPSGREIAYSIHRGRVGRLLRKAADGAGEPIVLVESEEALWGPEWSRDGRYLSYTVHASETGSDIRYVELRVAGENSEPAALLGTPADEGSGRFSPDGRYLAYRSDESGRNEVYVRPFPDGAGKWQVSVNGGEQPRWRGDGKELFYREGGDTLMAVAVSTEPTFTVGPPQRLFESVDLISAGVTNYDVSPDGERFLTISTVEGVDEEAAPPKIRVVQNWLEEFRDRRQD